MTTFPVFGIGEPHLDKIVIAIDGPAASGKSTVAKVIARELSFLYVDSGALYRGITWAGLSRNIAATDCTALVAMLDESTIECSVSEGEIRFTIDAQAPCRELRSAEVNNNVSHVAAQENVRLRVVNWLRDMIRFGDLVMEGRDIGTKVFSDARYKFYLDATENERTRRRHLENAENLSVDEVGANLKKRDAIDSSRTVDPLKVAPDAHVIDTTKLSVEDVVARVVGFIDKKPDEGAG